MLILENGEFQRKEKISRWGKAEVRVKPLPRVSSHRGHVSPHPWLHRKKLRIFECCSPVIFRLEVTNRNESCSAAHSKFVLQRGPLDESSCTVNSQDDQRWLPDTVFLTPDVGIAVCPASDDAVTLGSPVNTCNVSVVLLELMSFYPLAPILLIYMDFMIIGARGNLGTIPVPGMTSDWL